MMNIILSPIKKLAFVLVFLGLNIVAQAATYTWTGASSTDWNDASNWSAGFVDLASLATVDVLVIPDASTTPNDPTTLVLGVNSAVFTQLNVNANAIAVIPSTLSLNISNATATSSLYIGTAASLITNQGNISIYGNNTATAGIECLGYFWNNGAIITISDVNGNAVLNNSTSNSFINSGNGSITICGAVNGINNVSGTTYNGTYDPAGHGYIYIGNVSGNAIVNNAGFFNIDNTGVGSLIELGTANTCGAVENGINNTATGVLTNTSNGEILINANTTSIANAGTINNITSASPALAAAATCSIIEAGTGIINNTGTITNGTIFKTEADYGVSTVGTITNSGIIVDRYNTFLHNTAPSVNTAAGGIANTGVVVTVREACASATNVVTPIVIGDLATATYLPGTAWTSTTGNGTLTYTAAGGELTLANTYAPGSYDFTYDITFGGTTCTTGTMLLSVGTFIQMNISELNVFGLPTGRTETFANNPAIANDTAVYRMCSGGGLRINSLTGLNVISGSTLKVNLFVNAPANSRVDIPAIPSSLAGAVATTVATVPVGAFSVVDGTIATFHNTLVGGPPVEVKVYAISYFDYNGDNVPDADECVDTIYASVNVSSCPALVCKNIQLSLDATCKSVVVPEMIRAGEYNYAYTEVELVGPNNTVLPNDTVTSAYIGKTITAKLINVSNPQNYCWANILVQDKLPPVITCPANLSVYCGSSTELAVTGRATATDCSGATITNSDYVTSKFCLQPDTLYRTFVATDAYGNSSKCVQKVALIKPSIIEPNGILIDNDTLYNCTSAVTTPTVTGYPSLRIGPAMAPIDTIVLDGVTDNLCNVRVTYSDIVDTLCSANTKKIIRSWVIEDKCSPAWTSAIQLIYIFDTEKPVFGLGLPNVITASTNLGRCTANPNLPSVGVTDACSSPAYVSTGIYKTGTAVGDSLIVGISSNGGYFAADVPTGTWKVIYKATDLCGNADTISRPLVITDNSQPVAICRSLTTINLIQSQTAAVPAANFDEGSYDCCLDHFEVKRMSEDDAAFRPTITFDCADNEVMIVLKVVDCSGNSSTCMVGVRVQDKLAPTISAPPSVTVECAAYPLSGLEANANTSKTYLDNTFGKVISNGTKRDSVKVNIYNDGTNNLVFVGFDGVALDNCSDLTLSNTFTKDINNCGIGRIVRTWEVTDRNGIKATASQTITILNSNPFNITDTDATNEDDTDGVIWPKDTTFTSATCNPNLDPSVTGRPTIFNEGVCDQVLVAYADSTFRLAANSGSNLPCYKLLRTWTIIDWCQFDANTGVGRWRYTQVIKVFDNTPPTFTSAPAAGSTITYGIETTTCVREALELPQFTVSDPCTPQGVLDANKEVRTTFPASSATSNQYVYNNVPAGTYEITYIIEDECGNAATRIFNVLVKDTKKPTPVCKFTTIDLMATFMVRLDSSHINNVSYDNCTPSSGLKMRLSRNVSNNPDTLNNFLILDCNDFCNSLIDVFFYVGDASGNWDYCITKVDVQNNLGGCPSCGTSTTASVTGAIKTEEGKEVQDVSVNMTGMGSILTKSNGGFLFSALTKGSNYTVEPEKAINPLNGVSTADLVLINKHILGISPLSSPYKYIAADVNKDGRISTADMVELRKMILLINNDFAKNKSWRFVDKSYVFQDPTNPLAESFPEKKVYNNININDNLNFVGVKIGDVNATAAANNLIAGEERNHSNVNFRLDNQVFNEGDIVKLTFKANEINELQGCQFALGFDRDVLEFDNLERGHLTSLTTDNFGFALLANGVITFSWNGDAHDLNSDSDLFTLVFRAKSNAVLSHVIYLHNQLVKAEAYQVSGLNSDINLLFSDKLPQQGFSLLQNQPNPFVEKTSVGFILPQADEATLTIYDLSGKVVLSKSGQFAKGYNEIIIDKSELQTSGVLHYQLSTSTQTATKKMVITN